LLDTEVGAVLTQFRADFEEEFIDKVVFEGGEVERVEVNGQPAYFISGEPHTINFVDENGMVFTDQVRLAGNVLIWERGDISLRLEADVSKAVAIEVAESVR
jgi:hypothetical protein